MITFRSYTKPTFKGRINRKRYFFFSLLSVILFLFLGVFSLITGSAGLTLLLLLSAFFYFILLFISLMIRRFHDLNRSGWWAFLFFCMTFSFQIGGKNYSIHALFDNLFLSWIIFLGALAILGYCLFFKGTSGSNPYGPDPLEYEEYDDYLEAINTFSSQKE